MSKTHRQKSADAACIRTLGQIEHVFAQQDLRCPSHDRRQARELAIETLAGFDDEREALSAASLVFALGLFQACASDICSRPDCAQALAEHLHPLLGISRDALVRELLSRVGLSGRSPSETVAIVLGLLVGLTDVRGASLWRSDRTGALHCVDRAGQGAESSAAGALARRLLRAEQTQAGPRAELFTVPVEEDGQVLAALVARSDPRRRGAARAGSRVVLPALAAALARDALMARNADDERALVEGGERRLMRLGFDLHDGPVQELLLLADDLRLFREQLASVLKDDRQQALLRGRLDDLDARLVALDGGLRRISTSLHASVRIDRPFAQSLAEVVDAFAARTGVQPELRLRGDAEAISPSQRIALLSVVGEALNNVREHGGPVSEVRVDIEFGQDGVNASVVDNGRGFTVEDALLSAARRGRMGLAGIHERVRLLGGRCTVDSRTGGPTSVSLTLPRWEPLDAATPRRRRADRHSGVG